MRTWTVYVLRDPRDGAIRNVGQTSQSLHARLRQHVRKARTARRRTHTQNWDCVLSSDPIIEGIETGTGSGWADAERRWIAFYRSEGLRLTNTTDGGEGVIGWGTPEQRRARAIKINASRSPEERRATARYAAAILHARMTPEERSARQRKARMNGLAHMTATQRRDQMRNANASQTPAFRAALGKRLNATRTTEERSATAKQLHANRTAEQRRASTAKARIMSPRGKKLTREHTNGKAH